MRDRDGLLSNRATDFRDELSILTWRCQNPNFDDCASQGESNTQNSHITNPQTNNPILHLKKFKTAWFCTMADYTLYLVTDSTPAILGDRDICDVVDGAIRGGVTIVQYRDKTSDTGALVATARRLHAVTQRHNVPLLINDRVDVALAVGCEGVHLGQDDMGQFSQVHHHHRRQHGQATMQGWGASAETGRAQMQT